MFLLCFSPKQLVIKNLLLISFSLELALLKMSVCSDKLKLLVFACILTHLQYLAIAVLKSRLVKKDVRQHQEMRYIFNSEYFTSSGSTTNFSSAYVRGDLLPRASAHLACQLTLMLNHRWRKPNMRVCMGSN